MRRVYPRKEQGESTTQLLNFRETPILVLSEESKDFIVYRDALHREFETVLNAKKQNNSLRIPTIEET